MRADKMTHKFQLALAEAQSLALGQDHQFIEPLHLMLALLDQEGSTVRQVLQNTGVNVARLRTQLARALERLPKVSGNAGEVHPSNALIRLLNLTDKLAQERQDAYIASELFVLAAFQEQGELARLLREQGADDKRVREAIDSLRGGEQVDDPNAEESRQALEKYTIDLTARAEEGKLTP